MEIESALARLESGEWNAAVFGLGYVGLPLVVTLARKGIDVTGIDISDAVVQGLGMGRSHIDDISDADLAAVSARTSFSVDAASAAERDVVFICVPTPLALGKQPDMSYVQGAASLVASALRPGHMVILESTTYPGTTEEVVLPLLEASGLKLDADFLLAYSPERVDPGNQSFATGNIPRVVGGASPDSTRAAAAIYRRFVPEVHVVSSARTAEMAKLLENTFRWVNIGLANEMSMVARAIGVDIWEVIDAAATKPFGFMPFYPGAGVGGHCIPLDPFYLRWAAELTGEGTRFVELADTVNSKMPNVVVSRIQDALNETGKALRGARILVLGVAYKPNIGDHRESPALICVRRLIEKGAVVRYSDPFVSEIREEGIDLKSFELDAGSVADADCVVILCDHDVFDYELVAGSSKVIFDARNALRRRGFNHERLHVI